MEIDYTTIIMSCVTSQLNILMFSQLQCSFFPKKHYVSQKLQSKFSNETKHKPYLTLAKFTLTDLLMIALFEILNIFQEKLITCRYFGISHYLTPFVSIYFHISIEIMLNMDFFEDKPSTTFLILLLRIYSIFFYIKDPYTKC